MTNSTPLISIIIPIHNGVGWINRCFGSILNQTAINVLDLEICVCNDASTDETILLLEEWQQIFSTHRVALRIFNNPSTSPGGVGYSKNRAVSISVGTFLCFQDIDDVMLPNRILKQYEKATQESDYMIVGCQFKREPENSTIRYTKWANSLSQEQLNLQVFTSHGPTVIMPTWFCHRKVFDRTFSSFGCSNEIVLLKNNRAGYLAQYFPRDACRFYNNKELCMWFAERIGGFFESRRGTPEDLVFFNKHLDLGGKICRVDECLVIYTFHPNQMTLAVHQDTIWNLRVERLERVVLKNWSKFTIWNAGKQGRKFYNSLSQENKSKVQALCDVDKNKIGHKYVPFDPIERKSGPEIDIIHFKEAIPPFVICIKIDLTEGAFENNLKALNLKEGIDYIMFS